MYCMFVAYLKSLHQSIPELSRHWMENLKRGVSIAGYPLLAVRQKPPVGQVTTRYICILMQEYFDCAHICYLS